MPEFVSCFLFSLDLGIVGYQLMYYNIISFEYRVYEMQEFITRFPLGFPLKKLHKLEL